VVGESRESAPICFVGRFLQRAYLVARVMDRCNAGASGRPPLVDLEVPRPCSAYPELPGFVDDISLVHA